MQLFKLKPATLSANTKYSIPTTCILHISKDIWFENTEEEYMQKLLRHETLT